MRVTLPVLPSLLSAAVVCCGVVETVHGHVGDPKGRNIEPIYVGPGYRRGADGAAAGTQYDASNTTLQSLITIPEFRGGGSGAASDCWGYVSPSGREYALFGLNCGTGFVEVTDPGNPAVLEVSPGSDVVPGPCCTWRDIKVFGEYAYVVSECGSVQESGIQVVDLRNIDVGIVVHVGNIDPGGIGAQSHNVAINPSSGLLYRCGGSAYGMAVFDLNVDPENPPLKGVWEDRYIHDLQVVTFDSGPYAGREIAFTFGGFNGGSVDTALNIVEILSDGHAVTFDHVAEFVYPNGVYSHQGWLSDDGRLVYLGDELDEGSLAIPSTTHVIDVSDIANPFLAGTFDNGNPAVTHNFYVRGDFLYEANYTSGLRVFDTGVDAVNPPEVAYFDTRPEDDAVSYSGAWSNYPLLPSGVVLISDRQRGLFVVDVTVDDPAPCLGDVDASGSIGFSDLLEVLANWGPCAGCPQDLDGSGEVGFTDVLYILSNWGPCSE